MYGFKIWCEISKVPFEISHQILNPYTAKYEFYEVLKIWRLMISKSYNILSLSETGPSSSDELHPDHGRWEKTFMPHDTEKGTVLF